MAQFDDLLEKVTRVYKIDPEIYEKFNVKRGLRNSDGTGVLVGLTNIGEVHGYIIEENEKVSVHGKLHYRGIDINDLVDGCKAENRHGFEEVIYLILFGELPSASNLAEFKSMLAKLRCLPNGFTEDMILKAPSGDIMNKLARSVLALYSYDSNPDDISISNVLRQSIELIARFPTLMAHAYHAKAHYHDGKSLILHNPKEKLSTAENILHMIRSDNHYEKIEVDTLDLALMLHAEHGGGNNSAFATHVVASSGTDTYSAIAAAVGSLKGPKHGGANSRVMAMIENIKANIDWTKEEQVKDYIAKIIRKEANDGSGLVYGMGHAVYTLSDPRAILLKEKAALLAKDKGMEDEFMLYDTIEKYTPGIFAEVRGNDKAMSANVDMYSGFVYKMLNIPPELYTPIFAVSRISGWCAHLIEEIITGGRIIRPAYKSVSKRKAYIPLKDR